MEPAEGQGIRGHRHALGVASEAWLEEREDEEESAHLLQRQYAKVDSGARRASHRNLRADGLPHNVQASCCAWLRDQAAG
eukprot:2694818-Prymnesium_polylepis.1